ncbi:TetR/AcrR family transcriptional regulator, partial [Haloquadratum walsbyi]
ITILPNAPDDTRTEILRAAFSVLCERGYTGVTISRIASRTDVAKSVVYYHYEDKDDVVQTLLDQVLVELISEYFHDSDDDPARRLEKFFGFVFTVAGGDIDPSRTDINNTTTGGHTETHREIENKNIDTDVENSASADERTKSDPLSTAEKGFKHCVGAHSQAYVELRAQATHDQVFRETIKANEIRFRKELHACIDAGVAAGTFDIDNISDTTELLLTLIEGAIFRGATTSEINTDALANILERELGIVVYQNNL